MVDNFEQIKSLFYFNEVNNMFFHCQIVARAKDHKGSDKKVKEEAIKTYFIKSREHLDSLKEEIILLCEHYKAKAYINVAGKDFNTLQTLMLSKIANQIHQGIISNPRKCLNSAAGELKSRNPRWVVDVDDVTMLDSIKDKLLEVYSEYTSKNNPDISIEEIKKLYITYIYSEIPTKSGVHLIVRPFNVEAFSKYFPDVDVHKNSMGTMLYYPHSLSKPTYCCSVCGGTNIQVQAWVGANTYEYKDNIGDDNDCWCEDCRNHTHFIIKK